MELWNDFEGKTVDGRFQLDHLIGPKGRSAYFTTKDEAGAPAMIRLIESLNDEEEILARWRRVTGLKQEHLVGVLASGQTVLDGTHLVYAVMEPTEMELADVLRERALTAEETRQIALSVGDGLEALHGQGLVHEHVEADNVLAQGETVKLRSDVVREAPEGPEGEALRTKDVRDLGLLVRQCLTRSRRVEGGLPGPFDEVVRGAENGTWGLKEILASLRPIAVVARPVVTRPAVAPVRAAAGEVKAGEVKAGEVKAGEVKTPVGSGSGSRLGSEPGVGAGPARAGAVEAAASTAPAAVASRLAQQGGGMSAHVRAPRAPDRIVMEPETEPRRRGLLIAIVAGVVLLVVLGIYFLRAGRAPQSRSAVQDTPSAMEVPQQSSENRPPAHDPASAPVPHAMDKPSAASGRADRSGAGRGRVVSGTSPHSAGAQWRVVAFTYNRADQAAQKVAAIAAKHPALKPEVFSPSGRAPYLVTVGGWMSVDEAAAVRTKARNDGLPRDTYTQNYRGK